MNNEEGSGSGTGHDYSDNGDASGETDIEEEVIEEEVIEDSSSEGWPHLLFLFLSSKKYN